MGKYSECSSDFCIVLVQIIDNFSLSGQINSYHITQGTLSSRLSIEALWSNSHNRSPGSPMVHLVLGKWTMREFRLLQGMSIGPVYRRAIPVCNTQSGSKKRKVVITPDCPNLSWSNWDTPSKVVYHCWVYPWVPASKV